MLDQEIYNQELVEPSCYKRSTTDDDLKSLSGISKSQTREFVLSKFKIKESIESKLHVVMLVSSTRGSFRFRV